MKKRNREINIFSMSALDLFASALGAFIIITIVLLPYYKKEIVHIENKNRKLQAEIIEIQDKLKACGEKLQDSIANNNALEAEIQRLKQRNDELATENRDKDKALENKERQLEEKQSALDSAQDEVSKLKVKDLEIVFVMDATGSLDEELADLKENMLGIVRVLDRIVPNLSVGFIAYRDFKKNYDEETTPPSDDYVTRVYPLTKITASSLTTLQNFVNKIEAEGGGDWPEAAQEGLQKAADMNWSTDTDKVIILIGDAPSHSEHISDCNKIASDFTTRYPRGKISAIFAAKEETNAGDKDFYKNIAKSGNGSYVHDKGRMLESILLSIL